MEEDIRGENPDLKGGMKVMAEFETAVQCRHYLRAAECASCRGKKDWLDGAVKDGRTISQVLEEFKKLGKIAEDWLCG